MSSGIIKEKIAQAVNILKEKNIDMWLTFVRESSTIHDPALDMLAGINLTWHSALIINKDGEAAAIVGDMEKENILRLGAYDKILGFTKSVKEVLADYIKGKNPSKIAINYSVESNLADGLTHGMYLTLCEYLKDTGYDKNFVSSEDIIAALKGRKSASELKLMKEAIKETLIIFNELTAFIKPGKTEKDIADFVKEKVSKRGYGMAWDDDHCPAVFTGPDPSSAHAGPTDRKVEKGHLINMDFGIKYHGYCSDLQRTWYVLRDGEDKAPEDVQKGFDIIRDSIQKVADALKPGLKGVDMDKIARDYITGQGYEEYPHGLGHQVGTQVHDGGAGLYPAWEKYGNSPFMPLEENNVLTIEPRLPVKGFGVSTLEEEVVITKDGCEFLSDPQKELWLIK
jgi:Xaa-Pro aminopeptidase